MGGALIFQKPSHARDGVRGAHRDVYCWRVSENLERNPEMSVFAIRWSFRMSILAQHKRIKLCKPSVAVF